MRSTRKGKSTPSSPTGSGLCENSQIVKTEKIKEGFWRAVGNRPFGVLLIALIIETAVAPSISILGKHSELFEGMRALTPLSLLVVFASILALWQRARHHAVSMMAAGIVIVLMALGGVIAHRQWVPFQLAAQIVFLCYVLWVVIRSVFTAKVVTGDVLSGAVCVYLLVGVVAGLLFVELELFFPGSFRMVDSNASALAQQAEFIKDPGWLLYLSFVTLTTVGCNDLEPASSFARSATVLVAVVGQILLMVMIARLVGMNVVQASKPAGEDDPPRS